MVSESSARLHLRGYYYMSIEEKKHLVFTINFILRRKPSIIDIMTSGNHFSSIIFQSCPNSFLWLGNLVVKFHCLWGCEREMKWLRERVVLLISEEEQIWSNSHTARLQLVSSTFPLTSPDSATTTPNGCWDAKLTHWYWWLWGWSPPGALPELRQSVTTNWSNKFDSR